MNVKNLLKKDMSLRAFWCLTVCVFFAKAVLGRMQDVRIWVGGAPLDDELMFKAAQNIAQGNWLGPYTYLTLSKQMLFAVWLALCNKIGIPYLVAGQLLGCCAALAAAWAFAPVLKRNKSRFLLFAALAFSPAASASFTLRVYRDNIFPAECLLFFAGMIGAALRWKKGGLPMLFWLAIAGGGFGAAKITREDGVWLAPFALVATAVVLFCIWKEKEFSIRQKCLRSLQQAVPYVILALFVAGMSYCNLRCYKVFTTSDFSQGSFAAAYGAMTRIEQPEDTDPMVPVPKAVREQLYAEVPQLACLQPWLEESDSMRSGFWNERVEDYLAGSFYWVLRAAAQQEGVYDSAKTAQDYWQTVADEINAAIDEGRLKAEVGPRSTTTPVIRSVFVLPAIQEALHSFVYCATFQDCSCYFADELSEATAEGAEVYRQFLGNPANYSAVENEAYPYYTGMQLKVYALFDALRYVYVVLVPVLLVLSAALQIKKLVWMLKKHSADGLLLWLILLGVLGMALLRCGMIAYMEVAAFHIGTYVMYLASVHPLLLVYAVAGTLTAWNENAPESV